MDDPMVQILKDLGKLRGKVYTELSRLPAPDPLEQTLRELDGLLGRAEEGVRGIVSKMAPKEVKDFLVSTWLTEKR